MSEWYCFKCKEKMEEADITLSYVEVEGSHEGIKCPKCGTAYLLEQIVLDKVRSAEDEIDSK